MQESQPQMDRFDKLVKLLKRELEELENRLDLYWSDFSGIEGAVKAANEFGRIMRDLEALVNKDLDYFNVVTRVWHREGREVCDITVKGQSIEFVAEDVDCGTPVGKVLEVVLLKEENILYAFSKAFIALSNFASEIVRAIDIKEKLENLMREVSNLKATLKSIREVCS
jgi:hypothetical protein